MSEVKLNTSSPIKSEEKIKLSEEKIILDPNVDYLSEAKALNKADIEGQASLVLNAALNNSLSDDNQVACQEVYDGCKSGSDVIGLKGTWTITRAIRPLGSGAAYVCSGGILVRTTSAITQGGMRMTASFVAGVEPVGDQKAK